MSFLSKFFTVLHAVEAAATISAPFVALADPQVGALMTQANQSAISAEAMFTGPGSGEQKASFVAAQTGATIGLINSARETAGAKPLPANTADQIQQQVKVTVAGLNAISAAAPKV